MDVITGEQELDYEDNWKSVVKCFEGFNKVASLIRVLTSKL